MIFERLALWVLLCSVITAGACIVRESGTSVELEVSSRGDDEPRAALTNNLGYAVELEQLYLVLGRVELVACKGGQLASLLHGMFGPSVARAHSFSTPTTWATPHVLAPLGADDPSTLGVLSPPAVDYCSVRLSLEAADEAAERLPDEVDMIGLSMYVAGAYGAADNTIRVPFRYQSHDSVTAERPLVDAAGRPTKLSFSEDNLRVRLRIDLAYKRLLDGFILLPGSLSHFNDLVLHGILDHVSVEVLDDPN